VEIERVGALTCEGVENKEIPALGEGGALGELFREEEEGVREV